MILYPTLDEALELHRAVVEHFGGSAGVRDFGLLESALHRPQSGYYDDIVQMAAALLESLLMNHPFVDGNKRVAFFLTDVFLRMNGWEIAVQPHVGYHCLMKAISLTTDRFLYLERWLRRSIVRLK